MTAKKHVIVRQAGTISRERVVRRIHSAPPPLNTIGPPSLAIIRHPPTAEMTKQERRE